MLADIGNGTMNIMYINNSRPVEKKCFTEKYGTHQCVLAVRESLLCVILVWGGIEQYRKIWDDIYKMVLISSISFSAVLGNMVREYLSLNLIFLIFLINMGAIFLRMYLSKKKNKFIL